VLYASPHKGGRSHNGTGQSDSARLLGGGRRERNRAETEIAQPSRRHEASLGLSFNREPEGRRG